MARAKSLPVPAGMIPSVATVSAQALRAQVGHAIAAHDDDGVPLAAGKRRRALCLGLCEGSGADDVHHSAVGRCSRR